jgi:hypothetical protein
LVAAMPDEPAPITAALGSVVLIAITLAQR